VQWRVGLAWYLFAFVGLPAIETLGTIAIPGALASVTPIDALPELMSAAVFFVYPALLAGPLGEEIGWRGVALPRLQQLHGPVKASLILGVLWAFWHAPIWFSGRWSRRDDEHRRAVDVLGAGAWLRPVRAAARHLHARPPGEAALFFARRWPCVNMVAR